MQNGGASAGTTRKPTDFARLGRRIGVALFWLMACYVVGMSSASIIPSLYFPEHGPRPRAASLRRCAQLIGDLDRDLVGLSARALSGEKFATFGQALHEWDGRAMELAGGCGPLEDARKDLLRLRVDVEALLRRVNGAPRRTQERVRRALQQIEERAAAAGARS